MKREGVKLGNSFLCQGLWAIKVDYVNKLSLFSKLHHHNSNFLLFLKYIYKYIHIYRCNKIKKLNAKTLT